MKSKRLESLLSKGFRVVKCKAYLKVSTARIKHLRSKKEAAVSQMRKEVADLLKTGQDSSAHLKVEQVYKEQSKLAAYVLLEQYCDLVSHRITVVESQKNCPIELKEAIASIVFAAPQCPELEELQKVRESFSTKYGSEFVVAATELRTNCGVNALLAQNLSAGTPGIDTKLQLLKEIAKEHNVKWKEAKGQSEPIKKTPQDLPGPQKNVNSNVAPGKQESVSKMESVQGSSSQESQQRPTVPPMPTNLLEKTGSEVKEEGKNVTETPVGAVESPNKDKLEEEKSTSLVMETTDAVYHGDGGPSKVQNSSSTIPAIDAKSTATTTTGIEASSKGNREPLYPTSELEVVDSFPMEVPVEKVKEGENSESKSFERREMNPFAIKDCGAELSPEKDLDIKRDGVEGKSLNSSMQKEDGKTAFDEYVVLDEDSLHSEKSFTSAVERLDDDNDVNTPRKTDDEMGKVFSMQNEVDPLLAEKDKVPTFDDYLDVDAEMQLHIEVGEDGNSPTSNEGDHSISRKGVKPVFDEYFNEDLGNARKRVEGNNWGSIREEEFFMEDKKSKFYEDISNPRRRVKETKWDFSREEEVSMNGKKPAFYDEPSVHVDIDRQKYVKEEMDTDFSRKEVERFDRRKDKKSIIDDEYDSEDINVPRNRDEQRTENFFMRNEVNPSYIPKKGKKVALDDYEDEDFDIPINRNEEKEKMGFSGRQASYSSNRAKRGTEAISEEVVHEGLEREVFYPSKGRKPMHEEDLSYQWKGRKAMYEEEEVSYQRKGRKPMLEEGADEGLKKEIPYQRKGRKAMHEEDVDRGSDEEIYYQRKPMYEPEISYQRKSRKPMYEEEVDEGRKKEILNRRKGRKPVYEGAVRKGLEEEPFYEQKGRKSIYEGAIEKGLEDEVSYPRRGRKPAYEVDFNRGSDEEFHYYQRKPMYEEAHEEILYQKKGRKPIYKEAVEEELSYQRKARQSMYEEDVDGGLKGEALHQRKGRKPMYTEGVDKEELSFKGRGRKPMYEDDFDGGLKGEVSYQRKGRKPMYTEGVDKDLEDKIYYPQKGRKPMYTEGVDKEELSFKGRGRKPTHEEEHVDGGLKGEVLYQWEGRKPMYKEGVDKDLEEEIYYQRKGRKSTMYEETGVKGFEEEVPYTRKNMMRPMYEEGVLYQRKGRKPIYEDASDNSSLEEGLSVSYQRKGRQPMYEEAIIEKSPYQRTGRNEGMVNGRQRGRQQQSRQRTPEKLNIYSHLEPEEDVKMQSEATLRSKQYQRVIDDCEDEDDDELNASRVNPTSLKKPVRSHRSLQKTTTTEAHYRYPRRQYSESEEDESAGEIFDSLHTNQYSREDMLDGKPLKGSKMQPGFATRGEKYPRSSPPSDGFTSPENPTRNKGKLLSSGHAPLSKNSPPRNSYQQSYRSTSPMPIGKDISSTLKSPTQASPTKSGELTSRKLQWKSTAVSEGLEEDDRNIIQPSSRIATKKEEEQGIVKKSNVQHSRETNPLYNDNLERQSSMDTLKKEEEEEKEAVSGIKILKGNLHDEPISQELKKAGVLNDRRRESLAGVLKEKEEQRATVGEVRFSKGELNDGLSQESIASSELTEKKSLSARDDRCEETEQKARIKEPEISKGKPEVGSVSEESLESNIERQSSGDVDIEKEKVKVEEELIKNSSNPEVVVSQEFPARQEKILSGPSYLEDEPISYRAKPPADFNELSKRLQALAKAR